MADPASPSNNPTPTLAPGDSSSSSAPPPPPHDWEVLSMSMSSSALGIPSSASASLVCGCDACTGRDSGNRVPHSVVLPLSDQVNAPEFFFPGPLSDTGPGGQASEMEGSITEEKSRSREAGASGSGLPFGNWPGPYSADGSSSLGVDEGRLDVVSASGIEPFTEGWKPRLRTAAVVVSDSASFDDFHQYADSEHHHFQADYQQGAYPDNEDIEPLVGEVMAVEEFVITEERAGERILSEPNLVGMDKVPRKKPRKVQANTWWKRQAALWRPQSRSSAMWSIAVAATVLGIVIIGHRWQRERYQNQQLRLELCAKDEKLNDLMCQVNRLKEAITGRRRVPVMRSSSF